MALNSWVDVSFGVPVLEEQRVHGRFGFQLWKDCVEWPGGMREAVEFSEKTNLQATKGAKESKNDPNMVPFWSQIGPKMVPLATQNLDNCKGGPTKIDV